MVFDKWRARRQSVKELRAQESAILEEHLKLRELEGKFGGAYVKPPSYGTVVSLSGERVVDVDSDRAMGTRTSSTSGVSGMNGGESVRTGSVSGSHMSGNTR